MIIFTENDFDCLDLKILAQNSASIYKDKNLLAGALAWFKSKNYAIYEFDCSDKSLFELRMTEVLQFQLYYGYSPWTGNLDALNDAFGDFIVTQNTGAIFCFYNFNQLYQRDQEWGLGLLEVFDNNSRNKLLYGQRLIALIQSDDPNADFISKRHRLASWNNKEWQRSNR